MVVTRRETKYTDAVLSAMKQLGHATNAQLLGELHTQFPELSATTVHRVTARLCEDGALKLAPQSRDGSKRYDYNVRRHDHFYCRECDRLRDVTVSDVVIPLLNRNIKDCRIGGELLISGTCDHCEGGV